MEPASLKPFAAAFRLSLALLAQSKLALKLRFDACLRRVA